MANLPGGLMCCCGCCCCFLRIHWRPHQGQTTESASNGSSSCYKTWPKEHESNHCILGNVSIDHMLEQDNNEQVKIVLSGKMLSESSSGCHELAWKKANQNEGLPLVFLNHLSRGHLVRFRVGRFCSAVDCRLMIQFFYMTFCLSWVVTRLQR